MDVWESTHWRIEANLQSQDDDTPVKQGHIDGLISRNHHIAEDESPATWHDISDWLEEHHGDPAFKVWAIGANNTPNAHCS